MNQLLESHGDFRNAFCSKKIKTWIFDPPYNVGFKYGSKVNDNKTDEDYFNFITESAQKMFEMGEKDSNLFYINYPEKAAKTLESFESKGWTLKQWITWVYPINTGRSNIKCTRASRAVLWFTKGSPETNMKANLQPFRNPNDKRIKQKIEKGITGTHLYDWWEINIRKNVSKGYVSYYNQLPNEIIERIIKITTNENDVVGDLMAGSGSHIEPCIRNKRIPYMNDIDEKAPKIWQNILSKLIDSGVVSYE